MEVCGGGKTIDYWKSVSFLPITIFKDNKKILMIQIELEPNYCSGPSSILFTYFPVRSVHGDDDKKAFSYLSDWCAPLKLDRKSNLGEFP